jgi:hypothetical protein
MPTVEASRGISYINDVVRGEHEGRAFLDALNQCSPPDLLLDQLSAITSSARLRGFARILQKRLEQFK